MTDDRRAYRGYEILAAALHVAKAIDDPPGTPTLGILTPTSGATGICALAGWMRGKAAVPFNYLLGPKELEYVVHDSDVHTIIASRQLVEATGHTPEAWGKRVVYLEDLSFKGLPRLRLPASAEDDDLAVLLYTSGTSGTPKGVMLTHANIRANVRQCVEGVGFDHNEIIFGVLPQFHSFGFTVLTMLPLISGARVVYSARFVPQRVVQAIREHKPTCLVAIPSMYNALTRVKSAQPEDFESIKYVVSGGEPLPEAVYQEFKRRFHVDICEGFGLTETAPVTHWCLPHEFRHGTVGKPLPGVRQKIIDPETGDTLPRKTDGELLLAGPNVMKGYYKRPDDTDAAFTDGRWFRTGDMARIDDDFLSITGRIKDMLIVGGENVFPREIEEVINAHDAVHASAVIGSPDPIRGEVPVAYVEIKEEHDFDAASIRAHCREHLAGYKVPREVHEVEELPRGPTGKILRRELRENPPA
jgi:long-chain acyl-CoA synthetase